MLIIQQLRAERLNIQHFAIKTGESWCLVGGNGSGIEQFGDLLAGELLDMRAELLRLPSDVGILSFKRQQAIFEEEIRRDNTNFLNRIDPGTPARAFLSHIEAHRPLIELFGLGDLLNRGYRQLSSGQARKLCLLQQVTSGVGFLVLENPYEGLDIASCHELDRSLPVLLKHGISLLLLVGNQSDIPAWCSHLGLFEAGALVLQGPRNETIVPVQTRLTKQPPLFQVSIASLRHEQPATIKKNAGKNLITLRQGFARYGKVEVFSGLDLTINQGDHTLVTGPNGCGKSTLLQLIIGDHPLCYCNELFVLGKRRGTGESIWEIKQQMGIVSPELHRNHRVVGSSLAIVLSGFFDSIGLYARPSTDQQQSGLRWLERIGLAHKAKQPFRCLSYGEQRLVLLARALIKTPPLLILDEASQGLDEANRMALLDFLAEIAQEQCSTMLYVSHRIDEYRDFFCQQIQFDESSNKLL